VCPIILRRSACENEEKEGELMKEHDEEEAEEEQDVEDK
jgi:hypothetical protein